jgi:hypothetical protein
MYSKQRDMWVYNWVQSGFPPLLVSDSGNFICEELLWVYVANQTQKCEKMCFSLQHRVGSKGSEKNIDFSCSFLGYSLKFHQI